MLLERLVLENYGVYAGRSEFDLSCTEEKPIVLIGGLNGAGKTTVFESLMIALYGRTYLGRRATKKEYMKFVGDRIHRHGDVHADFASVEVAFRFYHNGCDDRYEVERSWTREGASVSESLLVRKNGRSLNDVDESQWQSFIEGLLPLGIAKLFFFDGEKIVRITEWGNSGNDEIRFSLDILLGAELINRLHSDLELYMVRRSGREGGGNDCAIQEKYDNMRREKEELVSEIVSLSAENERKNAEIQQVTSKINMKESGIAGVGGGYANIREGLLTQKATLQEKIRHQGGTIQEELGGDAPLYMMYSMMRGIKDQIECDMSIINQKATARMIREKSEKLKEEISSDEKLWPDNTDSEQISGKILEKLHNMFAEPKDDVFFEIGTSDASWLRQKISGIGNESKSLQVKISEYGMTVKDLEKIESELLKVPRDDEIGPKISEINALHQEIGILKSEVAHIDRQISSKRAYQRILQGKLKVLVDSIHKDKMTDAGMQLASGMQKALDTYSTNLREQKIRELESNLLDAVGLLLHKKHIHKIRIDGRTFEINAYGKEEDDGRDVENPVELKSMGERQMIGTALLWAIARTSGRSLPFVIDTPLGRLDGMHLSNLMNRFYPFASHQIVLLSTDREIGAKEYAELEQYTSRSYRITCDEGISTSTVTEGYFVGETVAQA